MADITRRCGMCGEELAEVPRTNNKQRQYFYCFACGHFFCHDNFLVGMMRTTDVPKRVHDWWKKWGKQKGDKK